MATSSIPERRADAHPTLRAWLRRAFPALIAMLLAAATIALFVLSGSKERSEARDELVSDNLLARESIRFQLARESEALQKLAVEVARGAPGSGELETRMRQFMRRAGQVQGVVLVDSAMHATTRAQREGTRIDVLSQLPREIADAAIAKARALGRPVFTNAFQADWGASAALFVPVPDSGVEPRFLVGIYSLDRLLEEMIPWNLAQDYEFTLSDVAGTVRARRASVGPGRGVYTHQEPLELGGTTLLLGTNSVRGAPDWIASALRAGIAALAALLLWSLWALWRDHRHDEYRRRLADVLEGRSAKSAHETQLMRKSGRLFPAAIYDAPLLDAEGRQVGWTTSIVDLSEQKQAAERERMREERMQTAARLTTMGEMASSLAHELNQPLGAIASYLAGSQNMLERGEAAPGELAAVLAKASAQTQRAGEVIRRVHEFVRKQEPRRESVELAALLDDCRPLVDLQARRARVSVDAIVEPGLAAVRGDPVMLQQVILNLTRNAIEAMADAPPERRRLVVTVSRDGAGERVSVRDFGAGIAAEDSEKVFAPFFTTRPEGMGMGLSICQTIVQAHGGRLWFERMDEGVAFHLWLPVAP